MTAPACAFAAIQSVTETYTIAPTLAPFSISFTLPGFDTALGTLTGIEMVLNTSTTAAVNVYNFNLETKSFADAAVTIPVTVTGPGPTSVTSHDVAGPVSGTVGPGGLYWVPALGSYALVAGEVTIPGVTGSASDSASIPNSEFSNYIGSTVNLSYSAAAGQGNYSGSAPTGVSFSGSATTGGSFDLIYSYETSGVPETSTWAMLGLGFAALGFASLRSSRKSSRFSL
ncbi:choice-of-anchor E domain-containing protein [Roseiarcus fermentans]|nr:choice-of-anchor E domain-containing protein [Roseiarcus fermentans]